MKKIFSSLLILYIFYFLAQVGFNYLIQGHNINYEITDNNYLIKINEVFRNRLENDDNNYSLTFDVYGDVFNFLTYEDFKNTSKIVKDVKYYVDPTYSCLFVKYKDNKILNDVVCKKEGIYYSYSSIENPSYELSHFIDTLKNDGYNEMQYQDNSDDIYDVNNILVYKNNYNKNHIIGLSIDKHFYKIALNTKNEYEKLYAEDINTFLEYFAGDYHIYADPSSNPYKKLKIHNIVTGEKNDLNLNNIPYEAYFIGDRQNLIYLYDPINHIEYEINPMQKSIVEAGNQNTAIKYFQDGRWITTTYDKFEVENIRFDEQYKADIKDSNFDKIYKYGNEYGFYYFIKKVNNGYAVYRSMITDSNKMTYLFVTDDYNSLRFIQDHVYYKEGNKIKSYNDKNGNRIVLENNIFDSYKFNYTVTNKKQEN